MGTKIKTIVIVSLALICGLVAQGGDIDAVQQTMEQPGNVSLTLPPTELNLQGCASPNGLVMMFDDSNSVGTVVAGQDGRFDKTMTIAALGPHNIQIYYEDTMAVRSDTSTYNVSIAPHQTTSLGVRLLPTISPSSETLVVGDQLTFAGFACPDSFFELVIDNSLRLPVASQPDGRWYLTISTVGYYIGEHTFQLIYPLGQSEPLTSQKKLFIVNDVEKNHGSTPVTMSQQLPPQITSPQNNYLSSVPNVVVTGTGQPNSQLEIWLNGHLSGSTFVNPLGEWSFSFIMTSSQYSIAARSCDGADCTAFSDAVTVYYYGGFSSCSLDFSLREYRFFRIGLDRGLDLNIDVKSGHYPYQILLDWGDESVENVTLTTTESVRYHHVFHNIGHYNGVITVHDLSGCLQTQYFTVEVVRVDSSRWWIVPGAIALSGSWLASRRYLKRTVSSLIKSKLIPPDQEPPTEI